MASPTIGLRAPLFPAIWVAMMVAMMFLTAAPMILTFHPVQAGRRRHGQAFVSTWVFVAAYMLVWALAGIAAYGGGCAAEAMAAQTALSPPAAARLGGVLLVTAGSTNSPPLKHVFLSKCRTPIDFIMTSWRDGAVGALRRGLLHGAYCLGCCWLLFLVLLPLGIVNIAATASVALPVFSEKTLPWGHLPARAGAAAVVADGAVVQAAPRVLPSFSVAGGNAAASTLAPTMNTPMQIK